MQTAAHNDDFPESASSRFLAELSKIQAGAEAARVAYCRGLTTVPQMSNALVSLVDVHKAQLAAMKALGDIAEAL